MAGENSRQRNVESLSPPLDSELLVGGQLRDLEGAGRLGGLQPECVCHCVCVLKCVCVCHVVFPVGEVWA